VKILFEQGTPVPLRKVLVAHLVVTAYELGWSERQNGDLIAFAEKDGFEVFVTTDRNLKYQQNLSQRRIAIVVLLTTSWPRIQRALATVDQAINAASPGSYQEVDVVGVAKFIPQHVRVAGCRFGGDQLPISRRLPR
jgi:hypothetical protein